MTTDLLTCLATIPDRRRAEGKIYGQAGVILVSILAMVSGARSYRQIHTLIDRRLGLLNAAFPGAASREGNRAGHGLQRQPDLRRAGGQRLQWALQLHLLPSSLCVQSVRRPVYEYLEAEDYGYVIRLPANPVLQRRIAHLLKRPVGRPPHEVRRSYASFRYQA